MLALVLWHGSFSLALLLLAIGFVAFSASFRSDDGRAIAFCKTL
jgi:hypothetical protein